MFDTHKKPTCMPPPLNLIWAYEAAAATSAEHQLELPLEPCKPPPFNVLWAYDDTGAEGKQAARPEHSTIYCYYPRPVSEYD
ncbi:MAG: hypothetical protein LRZ85_03725 [Alphaproteobacteria bacterium]|nr:hypothetical protein [Alphaproteobacteria bacterium]MCD8519812.1 hypothetical protein [Alphaproteobacteria bacterium]MCD8570276.1 hypothetical protein [Alphaproteobacteria bacterium]